MAETTVPPPGDVPELLGHPEVALLFGKSRATMDTWQARARVARALAEPGDDLSHLYPEPDVIIGETLGNPKSQTPAWRRDRMEAWGRLTGKPMYPGKLDARRKQVRAQYDADAPARREAALRYRETERKGKRERKARARKTAA